MKTWKHANMQKRLDETLKSSPENIFRECTKTYKHTKKICLDFEEFLNKYFWDKMKTCKNMKTCKHAKKIGWDFEEFSREYFERIYKNIKHIKYICLNFEEFSIEYILNSVESVKSVNKQLPTVRRYLEGIIYCFYLFNTVNIFVRNLKSSLENILRIYKNTKHTNIQKRFDQTLKSSRTNIFRTKYKNTQTWKDTNIQTH